MDRSCDRLPYPGHCLADKETIALKGSGRFGLALEAVVDDDQAILRLSSISLVSELRNIITKSLWSLNALIILNERTGWFLGGRLQ